MKRKFTILLLPFLIQCTSKHPAAGEYFEKYFTYQESIQKNLEDDSLKSIVYGNPEPEGEEHFKKKGDSLLLSLKLLGPDGKSGKEISDSAFSPSSTSPYTIFVEAEKSKFRNKNTYKVERTVEMLSPEVSVFDVFPLIDESIGRLRRTDTSKIRKESELQNFLCENFDCSIYREENAIFLKYTLSERMREHFPQMYKRMSKRLDQIAFRFQVFQPGEFSKGIEVYNEGKSVIVGIPDTQARYWSRPKALHLRSYFYISVLGLKFDIRGLGYVFRFSRVGNTDIVSGEFTKIPETNIGGRFLSIFPPGMVNLFIPEDMDQYAEDSFELVVNGSDGKKGNFFQTKTIRNGSKTRVQLLSKSEIFRDRFLPFKSKDKEDEPGFFYGLGKALVHDLKGK